jgi:AraC family transcriptional activator of pobA
MEPQRISTPLSHKNTWLDDDVASDIRRFNVFQVEDAVESFICRPYNRAGYYKISLHHGHNKLSDESNSYEFEGSALLFSSSDVVYGLEHLGVQQTCYFCVFTEEFFDKFAGIGTYEVFTDASAPVLCLTEPQRLEFIGLFEQMMLAIAEDFRLKYDLLRTLVMQLILKAIKLRPAPDPRPHLSNAGVRITQRFIELLEQQFPITSPAHRMALRHPTEFAQQLSLHVNYLNRVLKKNTGKTTSQLISERTIRDAQELLTSTTWNIVEIAWCLGYEDVSHFIKSFKTYGGTTPTAFRKNMVA